MERLLSSNKFCLAELMVLYQCSFLGFRKFTMFTQDANIRGSWMTSEGARSLCIAELQN